MLLHVVVVAEVKTPEKPELFVAGDSNVGRMAGVIAERMREDGAVVIMGCMGAEAINSALKATVIAHKFLAEALREHETVGLVPTTDKFEESGKERWRTMMSCVRVPKQRS